MKPAECPQADRDSGNRVNCGGEDPEHTLGQAMRERGRMQKEEERGRV